MILLVSVPTSQSLSLLYAMLSKIGLLVPLAGILLATLASAQVLVDFQVAEPPPVPNNAMTCTMMIIEYVHHFEPYMSSKL